METNPATALHSLDEMEFELHLPPIRKHKDGRIKRLEGEDFVPPSDDLDGVSSKDVVIDPATGLSARLYIPLDVVEESKEGGAKKPPTLVYFHGGVFCVQTPFSALHHFYMNSLVSKAKILAVSIHYRRAPEHLLPAAYEDCWAGLQWVLSHSKADGPADEWINSYADLGRVYLAGDCAGANIAHHVALRYGEEKAGDGRPDLEGLVLVHPFFWGGEKLPEELEKVEPEWLAAIDQIWPLVSGLGLDNPWINPAAEGAPSLAGLGCRRVLVAVGDEDPTCVRGLLYYEKLGQSGWAGAAELWVTPGENHIFHLDNPSSNKAKELMDKFASFLN